MAATHVTLPLQSFEKVLRKSIRETHLCTSPDNLLTVMKVFLTQGKKFEAKCIRELLDEALDESFSCVAENR